MIYSVNSDIIYFLQIKFKYLYFIAHPNILRLYFFRFYDQPILRVTLIRISRTLIKERFAQAKYAIRAEINCYA